MTLEHALELLENVVNHTAAAEDTQTQIETLQTDYGFTNDDLLEYGYSPEDIQEYGELEDEEEEK